MFIQYKSEGHGERVGVGHAQVFVGVGYGGIEAQRGVGAFGGVYIGAVGVAFYDFEAGAQGHFVHEGAELAEAAAIALR